MSITSPFKRQNISSGRVHGEFFGKIRPRDVDGEVSKLIDPDMLVEIEAEATMNPKTWLFLLLVPCVISCRATTTPEAPSDQRWWGHVQALAADDMQGRKTGSEGYRKAADYVARQFADLGLQPAGTDGYFQPIEFQVQKLNEASSSMEIRRAGRTIPITFGRQAIAFPLGLPGEVDAGLAFAGYGLTIPEYNHDDFSQLDVSGKVVAFIQGAPPGVPSTVAAHYAALEQRQRNFLMHGAVGGLMIPNPRLTEIPWERMAAMRSQFAERMDLAEPGLAIGGTSKVVSASFNPAEAGVLFEGSSIDFARVLEADAAKTPLPQGELKGTLRWRMVSERSMLTAPNVIAMLPGSDPVLKSEYVLLSAHLDHTGVGDPVNGDAIYNGAMDNASGVATLLEAARMIREGGNAPKRSILFLACTGEEEGLLGSNYFANHPTVPVGDIVANVNLDMFLPIVPMRVVRGYGIAESDLAAILEAAASELGMAVQGDPTPERNLFIRSDQYSFIKKGVPSLFLSVGYDPQSADEKTVTNWYATRYHAPSDDVSQPIDHQAAARFNQLMVNVSTRIANADRRPQWNRDSFFNRMASHPAAGQTR